MAQVSATKETGQSTLINFTSEPTNTEKDRHLHKRGSRMVERLKSRLAFKLMGATGTTLCLGLVVLGVTAISLQYNSALKLQTKNTRNLAALVIDDLDRLMMKGNPKRWPTTSKRQRSAASFST